MTLVPMQDFHCRMIYLKYNYAIDADSKKRRAFVATLFTAGYGERWALGEGEWGHNDLSPSGSIFMSCRTSYSIEFSRSHYDKN